MKHCLVLAPFLLSSAVAFTSVNQKFQAFVQTPSATSLKVGNFDYHGNSDRIQEAYRAWCRVYNKKDQSRLEIFAYHFLLAEKFFGQTGAPIKLNEYADLTSAEYMALQDKGSLPKVSEPTEVIVSETKASDYAVPEPVAPANYGPSAASYLDALSSQSQAYNTLSGAGITSYLDSVATNGSTLKGAGITSYLDTISGAPPLPSNYATSAPATPVVPVVPEPYVPPPPAAAAPSTPAPAKSFGNYMANLSSLTASSTHKGAGLKSYLDSVPTNGAIRGAGMTSYLDSVAKSTYTPFQASPAAPAAPTPFVPSTPPAAAQPIVTPSPPAQPYVPAESNTVASTGRSYTDKLSVTSGAAITPRGAGISSYLDTVSSNNSARQGGSGLVSYLDNVGKASPFATPVNPTPSSSTAAPVPEKHERIYASFSPPPPSAATAVPEAPPAPLVVPEKKPSYIPPLPSRNLPGAHWMDTVTPISSYGSHGVNGEWDDSNYQAANDRYRRRQAARNFQQAQAAAYNVGQQFQPQPSYKENHNIEAPNQAAAGDNLQQSQEQSLAERVQRRQQRQIETFGGGFIIS